MNKNYDSFINKAVIFGLIAGGFSIVVLAVKPSEIKKTEEPQQSLDISTQQAFEFELQKSLNSNHVETITTIELQNDTLVRIENAIVELAEVKEETKTELVKIREEVEAELVKVREEVEAELVKVKEVEAELVKVKEVEAEPVQKITVQKPVRASSTRWTVGGQRTYSDSFLAAHLAEDHGFNPDGYDREDMQTIHDNLHNGFSALGTSRVSNTNPTVLYSTSPTMIYSTSPSQGVFRTYSTSPTGGCP